MERFRSNYGSILFIVITDDIDYCAKVFSDFDDVVLSENSYEVDFAIMSFCKGGILSASTFSWWGAFYSKMFNQDNLLYVAPRYWIGHRSKKWHPEGIQTDWLTYQQNSLFKRFLIIISIEFFAIKTPFSDLISLKYYL